MRHLPTPDCGDEDVLSLARVAQGQLEGDPRDPDALFVLAASLTTCGHFVEAVKVLNRLIWVNGGYPGVWLLKRTVLEAMGDFPGAERCTALAQTYENG